MSAAVARRNSPRIGRPTSRTSSPMDSKRHGVKTEELHTAAAKPLNQEETKQTANVETSQPLAPPPRPAQQNPTDTPDYFSSLHGSSHFSLEPNPFEQSFGNPSTETPGKSLLPPVAALTSPALPGTSSASGYNWPNSLRSGPLSPAMLTGPAGTTDYFDGLPRGGFPTPNESSLRTGLTPGGGGSMFPVPSPNSQALFQQLASGGATPGTLDFHRTAMNAAAARKLNNFNTQNNTSQPNEQITQAESMDSKPRQQSDPFAHHDATDAANGLFLLAQSRDGNQQNNQFAMPNQPNANQGMQPKPSNNTPAQQTSPNMAKRNPRNASIGSSADQMSGGLSDSPSEQSRPNTRGKGKKGSGGKGAQTNGRRKAEDTPSKGPAAKKAKGNNGMSNVDPSLEGGDSEEDDGGNVDHHPDGRKMTDEEKRKNFLERNRVAALKCRQRKKQWLANLQAKVEIFSSENDALSAQVTQLREEIVNLKTLLLAHKDCPVSQAQGIGGMVMNGIAGDYNHHANPYGMAMQNSQGIPAGGMHRRFD